MKIARFRPRRTAAVLAAVAVAAAGSPAVLSSAAAAQQPQAPQLRLIVAQNNLTLSSQGGFVSLDPGIWLASLGAPLEFRVQRAGYTKPITISQVSYLPGGGTVTRQLPPALADGWNGLAHFLRFTVRNARGKVVASGLPTVCPNDANPQRASGDGAGSSAYPQYCSPFFDPFQLGGVWGIAAGWAVDAFSFNNMINGPYQIAPGRYTLTAQITTQYRQLFGIPPAAASAVVRLRVVKGGSGGSSAIRTGGSARTPAAQAAAPAPAGLAGAAPGALRQVPTLANPPRAALPDLIPLPAWAISTFGSGGKDYVQFGATVWDANAPIDVQGFRSDGSTTMAAYQYFWLGGKVIGRLRAGTMGFDEQLNGQYRWHFEQFARYLLLNTSRKLVVRDHKESFCIGPVDPINLLLPGVQYQPAFTGPPDGCGTTTNLWVDEAMSPGWGDTYFNSVAGQSFDITNVPNGTYYIEIIANPGHVLHELATGNDVSLRKIILGGKRGARTVRVPAWHGIDPE